VIAHISVLANTLLNKGRSSCSYGWQAAPDHRVAFMLDDVAEIDTWHRGVRGWRGEEREGKPALLTMTSNTQRAPRKLAIASRLVGRTPDVGPRSARAVERPRWNSEV